MRHTALELGNGTNILTLLAAKADASSVYTKTQVDGLIAGVAEGSTAAKVVNTIAERDALDPKRGFVWVVDATGDSTVVTGGAMYLYNEATSSWIKTAEAESMDLIVKWDDIQGKPEDITRAGNTFNTAGNLVKLGVDGKYPGIDGSLITNLSSANLNGQIGIGLIPISTNIATDAASDAKVATPKAVKTYVDDNTHTHSNKTTLDKIGEADGKMTFDGEEIGGSIDLSNYSAETIKLTGTKKIQIAGGSLTSGILDITTGDDGRPALTTPGLWSADIAGYLTTIHGGMQMDIYADSNAADVRIIAGANTSNTSSANGRVMLYGSTVQFNGANLNAANGLVQLNSSGKIPTDLYDAGTDIDLSNYSGALKLTVPTGTFSIGDSSGNFINTVGTTLVLQGNEKVQLTAYNADTRHTLAIGSDGLLYDDHAINTASGIVVLGSDGKLPALDGSKLTNLPAVAWGDIPEKPETFPASAHNHAITDVTGLEDALQNAGTVKSVNGATPDSSGAVTLPEATASAAGLMAAADKAKLDGISTSEAWYTVADAAAITLDRANGELQKVTLTQNCVLTAPVLDADHSTLLLQVTSSSAVTVTVGETNIVTDHTGTFQVGWYWDGEATRRYPAVEIS